MTGLSGQVGELVSAYGHRGDGSLEYVGLMLSDGRITELRPYRKENGAALERVRASSPFRELAGDRLSGFSAMDGVRLCDISRRPIPGGTACRMVYQLPRRTAAEDMENYMDAFFLHGAPTPYRQRLERSLSAFGEALSCPFSPLMQLGLEVDGEGRLLGVKYYLEFHKSTAERDRCAAGERLSGTEGSPSALLCENHYEPIFLGVNDWEGEEEWKLYFISRAFGHQTQNILPASLYLSEALGWKELTPQAIRELYAMGVYIQGVALSFRQPSRWRLYLNALPRTKF